MTEHLYKEGLESLFDASALPNPLKDMRDKNRLIGSMKRLKGFAKQHIDSFNEFIQVRLQEIITSKLNYRVLA